MANLSGTSADKDVPGVSGENADGIGVRGISKSGTGVLGTSESGVAVWGGSQSSSGVGGMSGSGVGVHGVSKLGPGVRGDSDTGDGVFGFNKTVNGVHGMTESGTGVRGTSQGGTGAIGTSESGVGIWGGSKSSSGVGGMSESGIGVHGVSRTGPGIRGDSENHAGVFAISNTGEAIHAQTRSPTVAAIAAFNLNQTGTGAAVFAQKEGSQGHAGFFIGNVHITSNLVVDGDIILQNADCAEDFDIADAHPVEPGTVMVLGEEGVLLPSQHAYDKRVAGVISGGGGYRPGIVLGKRNSQSNRQPIALLGKVYCKVDASYAPIEVGDLLTTSDSPGHAMKVADPLKAFGSVIGKALRPLKEGQGLIPILIALQ